MGDLRVELRQAGEALMPALQAEIDQHVADVLAGRA